MKPKLLILLTLVLAFSASAQTDCRIFDLDGTNYVDRHDFRILVHTLRENPGRHERLQRVRRLFQFFQCAGRPVEHNVLVVGLDSARWELVDILIDAGHLPTIERLVRGGSRGDMWCFPAHPPTACYCPPVWTTLSTGHTALRHGMTQLATPNTERRVKAIWDVLHEQGGTTTLSAYRHSWPPPDTADYVLTEQGANFVGSRTFRMFSSPFSGDYYVLPDHPTHVKPRELIEKHGLIEAADDPLPLAWKPFAIDRASMRFMDTVTREYGTTDLTMILFHSPDKSSHVTWAKVQDRRGEPLNADVILEMAEAWQGPSLWLGNPTTQYLEIDRWLGGFLERNHYSYVVLMSDHGMTRNHRPGLPGHHDFALPEAHWGIFSVAGPGVRENLHVGRMSVLDAVPMLSYLLDIPVSEELPGVVLQGMFTERRLRHVPTQTIPSWGNQE